MVLGMREGAIGGSIGGPVRGGMVRCWSQVSCCVQSEFEEIVRMFRNEGTS